MSYSLDVNVLLYASDETSPRHRQAKDFIDRCRTQPETLCLSWPTVVGFLRISTHPSIFMKPLSAEAALDNVDSLVRLPHVRVVAEQEGFWTIYREIAQETLPRGNLVADAHIAAILKQHGITTLYTNDSDFRKFSFLKVRNPFAPKAE